MTENKNTKYAAITITKIKTNHKYGPTVEELQEMPIPEEFYSLSGEMQFTMLNDAMFHIVLEANPELLKALLCSLMPLNPKEITSLRVTNPIKFGRYIDGKQCILDVEAILNETTRIDFELQVEKQTFWSDRSLEYLCRTFDNTEKGDSYVALKPAIHFGIVNFDTVPEEPEFFSTYHFANDRTHRIYTRKMRLSVLHLNRTDMATEEDIKYSRHFWARFFNVKTWEEMFQLAENNPVVAEAAKSIYRVTAEEEARWLCLSMERQARTQRSYEELIERNKATIESQNTTIENQNSTIENQNTTIENQNATIENQASIIEAQTNQLADADAEIAALRTQLAEALKTNK